MARGKPKPGGGPGNTRHKKPAQEEAAPTASEDAKPNVNELNAATSLEGAELPSDPTAAAPQAEPISVNSTPAPQPEPVSVNTTPAPSASSTPSVQQTLAPGRPSATPGPATRGKRSAPRGAGRRSQAQRDELERAENERRKQEAAQRAAEDKAKGKGGWRGGRGRGRGDSRGRGRGRGGYVGEFQRPKPEAASGPFSAGEIRKDQRNSGRWRTSGGISRGAQVGLHATRRRSVQDEAGDSGTFTTGIAAPKPTTQRSAASGSRSSRTRTAADGTRVKPDPEGKPTVDADGDTSMSGPADGGFISSDEEAEEKELAHRRNIDSLQVIDLTQDDDDEDPRMLPGRLTRLPHRTRQMGINADGATTKDGVIAVGANDRATDTRRKGKQRAVDDPQALDITQASDQEDLRDTGPNVKPDPEAPSAAEEHLGEPQPSTSNVDDLPHDPPTSPESKRKAKELINSRTLSSSSSTTSQPRPDLQTQEEIEEWERNQSDLRILRHELGTIAPTPPPPDAAATEDAPATSANIRDDKVYLFQFPPVLPDLAPASASIKPDPDEMLIDSRNSKENPIDIADSTTSNVPKLPAGLVGKLNVHASGRATLDWGGTRFVLGMGAEASFLQDCFVARVPPQEGGKGGVGVKADEEDDEAVALSMGQVKGKFVVTPDWEGILG